MDVLSLAGKLGVSAAAIQIGIEDSKILELANEKAIEYAKARGAELVGMRVLSDGSIVENPSAQWAISESTRDSLRELITSGMEEGWSNSTLQKAILDSEEFSQSRALMIARTETAYADTEGNAALYRESGVVKQKEWLTAGDDVVSEECIENEEAGPIPFEEEFPDGSMWPPAHPNCRCVLIPVLEGE